MIKLIATDMDGTLLKSNGQLPHEFSAVLNNLIDKEVIKDLNKLYDCKAVLCGKKSVQY